jgi:microcystin-dependent protein
MAEAEQGGVETGRGVGASLRREVALLRAQLDDVQAQLDMAQDESLRPEEVYQTDEIPAGVTMGWWGGATIPPGWLLCDGSAVSRLQYARLFRAIGTAYGVGDGSTTFNLPNCADRFPAMSMAFNTGTRNWETLIEDPHDETLKHIGGEKTHTHGDHAVSINDHSVPSHTHTIPEDHKHGMDHVHEHDHAHQLLCEGVLSAQGSDYTGHTGGAMDVESQPPSTPTPYTDGPVVSAYDPTAMTQTDDGGSGYTGSDGDETLTHTAGDLSHASAVHVNPYIARAEIIKT